MGHLFRHLFITAGAQSDSLFERLLKRYLNYSAILSNVKSAIGHIGVMFQNPKSYAREIVVLITVLFLIFLIILLTIVLILAVKKRLKIRKIYGSVELKLTRKQLLRYVALMCTTLAIIIILFATSVSSPSACGGCHIINKPYSQWKRSVHKNVSCVGCHYEQGIYGYAAGTIRASENLLSFVFKPPSPLQPVVSNGSCLSCHSDVEQRIIAGEQKIRVKHKEILAAGISCMDCHNAIAHEQKKEKAFIMNICVRCHDNDKASALCNTCHREDIAYKPHTTLDDWPKVRTQRIICTGCHKAATDRACGKCHGLELPHSKEFKKGHAMQAETHKELCYKCHWDTMSKNEMCACHKNERIHGDVEKWYFDHRKMARMTGISCSCHAPIYCGGCHENPSSIYPPGYKGGFQHGGAR
jgi:nitrate/TMAO reductase-like tetraheme cytochrome c subunit